MRRQRSSSLLEGSLYAPKLRKPRRSKSFSSDLDVLRSAAQEITSEQGKKKGIKVKGSKTKHKQKELDNTILQSLKAMRAIKRYTKDGNKHQKPKVQINTVDRQSKKQEKDHNSAAAKLNVSDSKRPKSCTIESPSAQQKEKYTLRSRSISPGHRKQNTTACPSKSASSKPGCSSQSGRREGLPDSSNRSPSSQSTESKERGVSFEVESRRSAQELSELLLSTAVKSSKCVDNVSVIVVQLC